MTAPLQTAVERAAQLYDELLAVLDRAFDRDCRSFTLEELGTMLKPRAWTDVQTTTHEDLRALGIPNPDAGRTCGFCQRDIPSGYRHEHGRGVCVR